MSEATAPVMPAPPAKAKTEGELSQWQLIRRRFAKHQLAVYSLRLLAILYLLAVFAGFFAPYPMEWRNLDKPYAPPQLPKFSFAHGFYTHPVILDKDPITQASIAVIDRDEIVDLAFFVRGADYELWGLFPTDIHFFGAKTDEVKADTFYLLGADKYGRDILSRTIYGSRISLSIGIVSILITFILGVVIGGISGYLGGVVDNAIQRLIEIIQSFPQLPMWLALAAILPQDWPALRLYFAITIVLSLLNWTGLARVVRGKILSLREEDYAVAAKLLGASHWRILFKHLVPGFTSHIIVTLTLSIPVMILGETALSFLGLGLRPPVVSWGVMLQDCLNLTVVADYPWLLAPVIFIILTVLAFNFLGDGLRDAADPYASR